MARSLQGVAFLVAVLILVPTITMVVQGAVDVDSDGNTVEGHMKPETIALKTDDDVIRREEDRMAAEGFSVKDQRIMKESAERFEFQAEVDKLMKIIINSLYSNSEVFLRELISNASDAIDKIRFLALTEPDQLASGSTFEIRIKADKDNKTLTIRDTGIGMTKEELIKNLGTIAQSGTTEFLKKFSTAGGDTSLIGQFGVGFYSAFLVADTVTVTSKNNADKQYIWTSEAAGSFTVTEDPRGDTLGRGTMITLHIKEGSEEFLDSENLEKLVMKYSEFINFPIYMWSSTDVEREVPDVEDENENVEEETEEVNIDEEQTEETTEEVAPKMKTVTEKEWDWKLMNEVKPIWTRSQRELTEEDYNNFYKSFTKDYQDPLTYVHFSGEGEVEFRSLLYIPSTAPPNMFDPTNTESQQGVKLYVRRVFITDELKDILPKYLLFLKGVVDSEDLPLNVSREMLQEHKILKLIKKKVIRKAIAMFQELSEEEDKEKYKTFWKNYGTNIKLGVIEDPANRTRLSKLLMFHSSQTEDLTSLDDYISRMKEGQTQIYYLAGESKDAVEGSPLLEKLQKKGYEVLYMVDAIDEYTISNMEKYDGKYKLTNIAREGLKLEGEEDDKEKEKELQAEFEGLLSFLKKTLKSKIERVVLSNRLTKTPSAIVSSAHGWTANMERIIKAQALADPKAAQFQIPRRIMEINPQHPLIKELNNRIIANEDDPTNVDIVELLYETSAMQSGFAPEEPQDLARRIYKVMSANLNVDPNAVIEDDEPTNTPPATEEPAHDEL